MNKEKKYIVSLSGGKDSTAMLLRLLEDGYPVDIVLFCDTGLEFPEMYKHIDKLEEHIGMPIVRLTPPLSFEYYFYEHTPKRKNPNLMGNKGFSWSGPLSRWCTSRLKTDVIRRFKSSLEKDYELIEYVGIAADEPHRIKDKRYPLVEWNMTESDCLDFCKSRGFDWGGLYDIFTRVSCWCCPLQSLDELRKLRKHFPSLWAKLLEMDANTWRKFKAEYTVEQLDKRFKFEDNRIALGLPIKGREFFFALNEHLHNQQKCNK